MTSELGASGTARSGIIFAVAGIVLVAAAATLAGRLMGLAWIAPFWPDLAPMRLGTSICFAASAVAVLLIQVARRKTALAVSCLVLALAAFVVLYYFLNHETAYGGWGAIGGLLPVSAAFAFVLIGAGLVLRCLPATDSWNGHAIRACAVAAPLLAGEALLAQLLGSTTRSALSDAHVTVQTVALFVLLGGALVLVAKNGDADKKLQALDRYACWVTVSLATAVFLGWIYLENDEWRDRLTDTAVARDSVAEGISSRLNTHSHALLRLAQRWEVYGAPTSEQWASEAQMYLRDFPAVQGLAFSGPNYVVHWHVMREGQGKLVGKNLASSETRAAVFRAAAAARAPRLAPPLERGSGKAGSVFIVPVYIGNSLRGYITAGIRVDELLQRVAAPLLTDFGVVLRDERGVLAGDARAPDPMASRARLQRTVLTPGQRWTVEVWPSSNYLSRMRSRMPEVVFLISLLGVAIVAAAFLQGRQSAAHSLASRRLSARLTSTLESITDGFFTTDRYANFTYLNAEAERLMQRPRGELIGQSLWATFPALIDTSFEANTKRALADNCTVAFEEYYAPFNQWFSVKEYPSPDGLAVYFNDVTERRRRQQDLRDRERELRALAESMPQMVWIADAEGNAIYFNRRWFDYTGLTQEESGGSGWHQCVHPDDRPHCSQAWARALVEQDDYSAECRFRARDGQYRWMLVRGVPHRDDDDRVRKWMGTCTDVDDLKHSVDAMRASDERFRLLAKATNDGIWDWNLKTDQIWWNESFEALFGRRNDQQSRGADCIRLIHLDDREQFVNRLQRSKDGATDLWSADYRFQRADGTFAEVLNRGYVIRDEDGRAIRMVGSMSDVTQRRALEAQLRRMALTLADTHDRAAGQVGEPGRAAPSATGMAWAVVFAFAARRVRACGRPWIARSTRTAAGCPARRIGRALSTRSTVAPCA